VVGLFVGLKVVGWGVGGGVGGNGDFVGRGKVGAAVGNSVGSFAQSTFAVTVSTIPDKSAKFDTSNT
jgi:hypothetical protein